MTTISPTSVPAALDDDSQSLIDSRLDTIERVLGGRTTRGDRQAIVREVESQIYDLLAARNPDDTDRDAVIAALAHLDPPEAYQAEGPLKRTTPVAVPSSLSRAPARRGLLVADSTGLVAARTGAAVGLSGLLTYFIAIPGYFQMMRGHGRPDGLLLVLPPLLALVYVQSCAAIAFATYSRFTNRWAIVGMGLGVVTMACCAVGPIYLMIR